MKLHFLGANRQVTGSRYLLEVEGLALLQLNRARLSLIVLILLMVSLSLGGCGDSAGGAGAETAGSGSSSPVTAFGEDRLAAWPGQIERDYRAIEEPSNKTVEYFCRTLAWAGEADGVLEAVNAAPEDRRASILYRAAGRLMYIGEEEAAQKLLEGLSPEDAGRAVNRFIMLTMVFDDVMALRGLDRE